MLKDPPDIEARRRLNRLGEKLTRARNDQGAAMQEIAQAAREALEHGVTRAEIAKRAQISRPHLNRLLDGK
jgi:transcriptional regulator with XRE-family HTH domain